MSETDWAGIGKEARAVAVEACWAQWIGLGSMAAAADMREATSIVDVEALILTSLYLREEERRLADMVAWWAEAGADLTSLQRMRAVAKRFLGESGADGLRLFAAMASAAGDRRWNRAAEGAAVPDWVRLGKGPDEPALSEPCALWPRLRAGFGVGAKADSLTFLLGLRDRWASASLISFATGYSKMSVGQAVTDMARARLIRAVSDRPAEYVAPRDAWATLLNLCASTPNGASASGMPPWRFWSEMYAFLAGAAELAKRATARSTGHELVLASAARDLVTRHARVFNLNNIPAPPMEIYRGRRAVEGLERTILTVGAWMKQAM